MKKIMAVLLAAVMTLAMAVTAFADEGKQLLEKEHLQLV